MKISRWHTMENARIKARHMKIRPDLPGSSFFKGFFTVSFFTAISRVFGFFRDVVFASIFGASLISDVFLLALRLPSLFRRTFGEGAFNASFLPIFSKIQGKKFPLTPKGHRFSGGILFYLCITLAVLVVVVEIIFPWMAPVVFPGLLKKPFGIQAFVILGRILFPYVFLMCLAAFYSSILNGFSKFSASAFYPALGNMVCIVGLLVFLPTFSFIKKLFPLLYSSDPLHKGIFVAWFFLFSGVIQLFWVMGSCVKNNVMVWCVAPKFLKKEQGHIKQFFKNFIPGIASVSISNINIFIGMSIASFLPSGSVTYLNYSDRLNQLPLSLIGTALGTTLLPLYTRTLIEPQGEQKISKIQNKTIHHALLLAIPLMCFFIGFSRFLIETAFGRGAFQTQAIIETSYTLMAYSLGLPAYILIKVLNTNFFFRGKMKIPLLATFFSVFSDVTLSIILMIFFQHIGIALSTSIAAWINFCTLFFFLKKHKLFFMGPSEKALLKKLLWGFLLSIGLTIPTYCLVQHMYSWHWTDCSKFFSFLALIVSFGFLIISGFYMMGLFTIPKKMLTFLRKLTGR